MATPTFQQQEISQVGSIIGAGTGTVASSIGLIGGPAALAGTTGVVLTTVGIGAAALAIAALVFHGADPRQVPAAKINQACIGAADKFAQAYYVGMISHEQALEAMDWVKQVANGLWAQHPELGQSTNSKIQDTIPTIMSVVEAEKTSKKMNTPVKVSQEIDPSQASSWYPGPNQSGWYPDSVQAATKLVQDYLAALPKNFPTTAEAGVQTVKDLASGNLSAVAADIQKSSWFTWALIILTLFGMKKLIFG